MRCSWVAGLAGASLLAITAAGAAQPEPEAVEAPWTVGFSLSAGGMLSPDQRDLLHLGGIGGTARLSLYVRPLEALGIDWLEGGASFAFTVVGGGVVGGVLDLELAVRAAPDVGGGVRPWLALGVGPGWTGALTRPVGTVGVGLWIPVTDELVVGPELGLLHVVQDDGPAYSDDALFLSGGLALAYRHVERPPTALPEPAPEPTPIARPEPPPPPIAPSPPRERRPLDEDLLFLVERAVPGSSLSVVILVPPVIFDHDAHELTPAGEVSMHDVLERLASADPEARVVIEGHADETGTPDYNLALSRRRAETVAAWLTAHGVPADRMRITAEGALRPLVVGESIEALAPNRRVTIRIEVRLPSATEDTRPTEDTPPEASTDSSEAELPPDPAPPPPEAP